MNSPIRVPICCRNYRPRYRLFIPRHTRAPIHHCTMKEGDSARNGDTKMFNISLDFLRFCVAGAIMAVAMAAHSFSPEHTSSVLASAGLN